MDKKEQHLFDNPKNVKRLLNGFYVICLILFLLDFVIHRHVYHSWENLWGFYPIYGFVGCVILVFVATWMRTFLMRSEDYYQTVNKTQSKSPQQPSNETGGQDNVDA